MTTVAAGDSQRGGSDVTPPRPTQPSRLRPGTFAVSWGRYGGFYMLLPRRICLGWVAFTYVSVELDDLMRAYVEAPPPTTETGA